MSASRLARRARRPHCRVVSNQPTFLSGKLLLAMPGMADPRFERAVVAMCVHDENGAIGVGIGHKRAGISFRGLLKQLEIDPGEAPDCAVHHGGPVEPGRGFVLHSSDWGGQDTLHVNGPKGGNADLRCTLEARVNGIAPVAVTEQGNTVDRAIIGAAKKAVRALDHQLGKLADAKGH